MFRFVSRLYFSGVGYVPSAACKTLTSNPLNVLLASSSSAQSGEVWVRRARLDRGMLDGRCFSEDEIR